MEVTIEEIEPPAGTLDFMTEHVVKFGVPVSEVIVEQVRELMDDIEAFTENNDLRLSLYYTVIFKALNVLIIQMIESGLPSKLFEKDAALAKKAMIKLTQRFAVDLVKDLAFKMDRDNSEAEEIYETND